MRITRRSFVGAAAWGLGARLALPATAKQKVRRPNLVVIMTDNQGAWTLGCYGNRDIHTPNIDRLAREGMLFSRAFASNAVCSPTRATFLTGLIPSQHGVHCYLRANEAQMGPDAYCTIKEFPTLPKTLAAAGYTCGLVGKWHLGANLRPQEGFTSWVTTPHGHTSTFYGARVIEDGEVRKEKGYLTDFWTARAVHFIQKNKDRPLFLFLTYNGPYGLGKPLEKAARNRHAAYYADKLLPSFPRREQPHPWQAGHGNRKYVNDLRAMRRYAAEVSGVDDGVGRVLDALKRLGLENDTLVVFTADQGWGGGQNGIWGMGDHTRPLHAYDATMHVPLIFRHVGSIRAGETCERMVCNYDIMPTLLSYLGLEGGTGRKPASPGRNFAPFLHGRTAPWEDVIFYEFENTRCIRTAEWKYVRRHPAGPHELYDLKNDPRESSNLLDDPAHAATRKTLRARLDEFFARHAEAKYDLWRGGKSKAARLTRPLRIRDADAV